MDRIRLGLLVLAALVWPGQPPCAQQQGSKIHMHAAEGYAADGFLFSPPGQGPFPAILLIHDSDGLSDYVRATAERLASTGKVVVAIDLYHGRNAGTAVQAQQLAHDLSDADAMHDLGAAVAFLESLPTVRPAVLGVAGWGTGSRYALQLANDKGPRWAVAISAVDVPIVKLQSHCMTAFMGSFAGDAATNARNLQSELRATVGLLDIKAYSEAHGRFYDPAAENYRAKDSVDLSDRLTRFFDAALAPGAERKTDAPKP